MRGVLDNFTEEIIETPEKPAAANLFRIKDDNKQDLLGEKQDQAFHHAVAKLLFNGIRFRKDAQTAIALLTTRVKNPAEDNWKKLRRLLGYLQQTITLPLTMCADRVNVLKW